MAGAAAGVPCGATIQVDKSDAKKVAKLLKERADRSAKADSTRSWADKVSTRVAWFVLGVLVVVPLALFILWLFGWN